MSQPRAVSIETVVASNEKLLKALIALLSIRDEALLDELKTIFTVAAAHGSEIGQADPKVWAEIRRELGLIDQLVYGDDERPKGSASNPADQEEPSPRPS
jgi:hypothetical protein